MNLTDLCRREVVTIAANAPIRAAAHAMRQNHVGALVVTDPYNPGRCIGVVTDRDLVIDVLAQGRPVDDHPIGSIANTQLVGVQRTASIKEAIDTMRRAGVRRLMVLDRDNGVIGLVSADDVLHAIAQELGALANAFDAGYAQEGLRTSGGQGDPTQRVYLTRNGA